MKLYKNKEWLKQKHLEEDLSMAEMARIANCKWDTIHKWLLKYNIPIHTRNIRVEIDKAWLRDQYLNQKKTMKAIAQIKQCSIGTIQRKLKDFGIPSRGNTEARKLYWKQNFVDRVGERYNNLTIIEYAGQNKHQLHLWKCKCDCENEVVATYNSLSTNHTKSCGCIRNKYAPNIAALMNLFSRYKAQAKSRDLEFALTLQQFRNLTSGDCYYCKQPPDTVAHLEYNNGQYIYNGIDRLDSTKGYTIENVITSCGRCNVAKGILSQREFLDWIIRVYEYQNGNAVI